MDSGGNFSEDKWEKMPLIGSDSDIEKGKKLRA